MTTDAGDIAATIAAAWARIAADISELDEDSPWLADPGGRDWLYLRLTEWHRADIGATVVHLLPQQLPLSVAGLCAREIIRECNPAYVPIAAWIATETTAGGVDGMALFSAPSAKQKTAPELLRGGFPHRGG